MVRVPVKVTRLDSESNQPGPRASSSNIQSGEKQQKAFVHLRKYIDSNIPGAEAKIVKQGLYLPSFENRNVKINNRCTLITQMFSRGLFIGQQVS